MTDKELIARLLYLSRVTRDYDQEDMTSADYADMPVATKEAADRIEALTAKLAKAVEALRFYAWENEMRLPSDGPWGAGSTDFGKVARATLAEIKGESHE